MNQKKPISAQGLLKLTEEWDELFRHVRPKLLIDIADAAAQGDRSENAEYIYGKKKLREIDKRLRALDTKIQNSQVVEKDGRNHDRIVFGARIKLQRADGREMEVQIVGEDEIEPELYKISKASPLGKSLMGHPPEGKIVVQTPKGIQEWVILRVDYP